MLTEQNIKLFQKLGLPLYDEDADEKDVPFEDLLEEKPKEEEPGPGIGTITPEELEQLVQDVPAPSTPAEEEEDTQQIEVSAAAAAADRSSSRR